MMRQVTIIGLGLIGGSVARGLRDQGLEIVAFDRDFDSLKSGLELGIIDRAEHSIAGAVANSDLVLIAVPVLAMTSVLTEIKAAAPNAVLTDVGSVKQPVLDAFIEVYGSVPSNFVPGHPIAGSEKHGVAAANPHLFKQHRVLLTPLENTEASATSLVRDLWSSLGAEVSLMTVAHHDSVLAQTSHLPHLLAYALIDTLSVQGDSLEIFDYAAGGLRDFSRIAASDPTMWRDIFMSNREPLLAILDQYTRELGELRQVIESNNATELFERLSRSKAARDHFSQILEQRQSPASHNESLVKGSSTQHPSTQHPSTEGSKDGE